MRQQVENVDVGEEAVIAESARALHTTSQNDVIKTKPAKTLSRSRTKTLPSYRRGSKNISDRRTTTSWKEPKLPIWIEPNPY